MKKVILAFLPLVLALILIGGFLHPRFQGEFVTRAQLLDLLRTRDPSGFIPGLRNLLQQRELGGGDIRQALVMLDDIQRAEAQADHVSAEAARCALFLFSGYPERAITRIQAVLPNVPVEKERAGLLLLLGTAQKIVQDLEGLRKTSDEMKKLGLTEKGLESFLSDGVAGSNGTPAGLILLKILFWIFLVAAPFWFMEAERQEFLEKFPEGTDRVAPFAAFRRSPLAVGLALLSTIFLLVLKIPFEIYSPVDLFPAFLHFALVLVLCSISYYRLDSQVRGVRWNFLSFFWSGLKFSIISGFPFIAGFLALVILRKMAQNLPMWPVLSPVGIGLGFPALGGGLMLLGSFFFSLLLGCKPMPKEDLPEFIKSSKGTWSILDLPESGLYDTFHYGYLSANRGVAITSPLARNFPKADLEAILGFDEGKFVLEHHFYSFLVIFEIFLGLGFYAAMRPLEVQKFLLMGPSFWQALTLFFIYLLTARFMRFLARQWELEADLFAAEKVGREAFIQALSKVTSVNFHPNQWREDDVFGHPRASLEERKRQLRARDGTPVFPKGPPASHLLVALWKSRLALDWKAGEAAAVEIASLDDDLHDLSEASQLQALGTRHSQFGAECLIAGDGKKFEVLFCAQKACARYVDPPLPVEKICHLCSQGMIKALGRRCQWSGTQIGCQLTFPGVE